MENWFICLSVGFVTKKQQLVINFTKPVVAFHIEVIKRPARDACLCMGELQAPPAPPAPAAPPAPPAPPAPHFVFLITL